MFGAQVLSYSRVPLFDVQIVGQTLFMSIFFRIFAMCLIKEMLV